MGDHQRSGEADIDHIRRQHVEGGQAKDAEGDGLGRDPRVVRPHLPGELGVRVLAVVALEIGPHIGLDLLRRHLGGEELGIASRHHPATTASRIDATAVVTHQRQER